MNIIDQILKEAGIVKKAWFPGREELHYFEDLMKQQKQIWPDAADDGYIITDQEHAEARRHMKELLDIYKAKITRGPGRDSTTEMFIPFEMDEGYYSGVIFKVFYHEGGKNRDNPNAPKYDPKFFSIEETRHHQKESGYKDDEKTASNNLPF